MTNTPFLSALLLAAFRSATGQACLGTPFPMAQIWTFDVVLPSGEQVPQGSTQDTGVAGSQWPFAGPIYSSVPVGEQNQIGISSALCTRLVDDVAGSGTTWLCEGTLKNVTLPGASAPCLGVLSYSGLFDEPTEQGTYTITGGTKDWGGAVGSIADSFNTQNGVSQRQVVTAATV